MKNEHVFLFPTDFSNLDGTNDESPYETIDIATGTFLGFTGVRIPADEEYEYDVVYGWQDLRNVRSTDPYTNLSDAADALADYALTNGEES